MERQGLIRGVRSPGTSSVSGGEHQVEPALERERRHEKTYVGEGLREVAEHRPVGGKLLREKADVVGAPENPPEQGPCLLCPACKGLAGH